MDTIIPDVDNNPALVEGALPILHIPNHQGLPQPVIVEALARLNAMDKMTAAGAVFTRAQVENLGWPEGTHIDWIPMRKQPSPPSPPQQQPAQASQPTVEQRVAALERYLNHLYRYFGLVQ